MRVMQHGWKVQNSIYDYTGVRKIKSDFILL